MVEPDRLLKPMHAESFTFDEVCIATVMGKPTFSAVLLCFKFRFWLGVAYQLTPPRLGFEKKANT